MRKLRKWIRNHFGKRDRGKTAADRLKIEVSSEVPNVSPSDPAQQHASPDLSAHNVNTTIQAVIKTSPNHATKTNIPPSLPPVGDPLAKRNQEVEQTQPLMKFTTAQAQSQLSDETQLPDSVGFSKSPLSCWDKAAENLKSAQPDVYKKLEQTISKLKDSSHRDPAHLINMAELTEQKDKSIPRLVEQTIRSILQFKEIIFSAANLDPHRIAPVVWRGFCVVLEACLGESTQLREVLKDLDIIASNISYWANIESLFLVARHDVSCNFKSLEPELINLYTKILELEIELVDWASDGITARVIKTQVRSVIWKDIIKDISNCHGLCKNTLDKCRLNIEQHEKIKNWISGYRPAYDHTTVLERTGVDKRYRACGQWLLNSPQFIDWSSKEPAPECQTLWLRGTTGTGKSTLIARIIQLHLDKASLYPNHRFAYFYCSRGSDLNSKHSYKSVLRALLQQAAYDPVSGKMSEHVLNAYKQAGGDSVMVQPFSFTNCNELLHGILQSGIKLRIMIDALDECDEPKELLKALRDASRAMPGGLELLVSSRYEVHVEEKLPNAVVIDLNKSRSSDDMIAYITTEVKHREEDERILRGKRPDLEDRLIEILCMRAGGMFRWVQLLLSFFLQPPAGALHPKTVEGHLDQLDTSSIAVEKDLYVAYDNVFERNTTKDTLEYSHASKIYKILLCCKEPMSLTAITTAVAFNEDSGTMDESIDRAYVRRLIQDFVIETNEGILEFAHVSVKDYLQKHHRSDYTEAKCQVQAARTCLQYISPDVHAADEIASLKDEFLHYSHRFWGRHCLCLSKEDQQSLGVSDQLFGGLVEGSGLTVIQKWLHPVKRRPYLSLRCLASESDSLVFAVCVWGFDEILQKLLPANLADNLNPISENKEEPLAPSLWAAKIGHKAIVKLLLDTADLDVDSRDANGRTPLSYAARHGHEAVVKLLLDTGKVEVDSKDDDGRTPLLCAARRGHDAIVKLLLDTGKVDIDPRDYFGQTPLLCASQGGHEAVVKLLLDTGKVNVDPKDYFGQTPLLCAAQGEHEAVVKLLLDTGKVNVDPKDEEFGHTPLLWAARRGHEAIVKLLLDTGKVDVDSKDDDGRTPLLCATRRGHKAIVKSLLDTGKVDVDSKDDDGRTPLICAARRGYEAIVKLLLDTGRVEVDSKDDYGRTPLLCAARRGHGAIVKLLLDTEKVDVESKDDYGLTPLLWAAHSGHDAIVKLLQGQAGASRLQ